jgi:hypothetical protein
MAIYLDDFVGKGRREGFRMNQEKGLWDNLLFVIMEGLYILGGANTYPQVQRW